MLRRVSLLVPGTSDIDARCMAGRADIEPRNVALRAFGANVARGAKVRDSAAFTRYPV